MALVDNAPLRAAVAAFAAKSEQETYLEVVRSVFQGDLLLDSTGSTITTTEDGTSIAAGSTLAFHEGTGPDGGRALFAFTRQEEVGRMHASEPAAVQTIGQPASGAVEFAVAQGYDWLYLDPAGPTCALKLADLTFVLRNPRNDAVKAALAVGRAAVVDAMAAGGILFYAVKENPDGSVQVRTSTGPGGVPARLAFTSAAEIAVRGPGDAFAPIDIARVVADALAEPFVGLVINPAGPWVGLFPDELAEIARRLS